MNGQADTRAQAEPTIPRIIMFLKRERVDLCLLLAVDEVAAIIKVRATALLAELPPLAQAR